MCSHRCSLFVFSIFFLFKLAHFKIPRYIKFVDEFPLTVTGKVSVCSKDLLEE